MKKLFTLLMLLTCVVGGVKAEDITIFSAKNTATSNISYESGKTTEITSNITVSGGNMYAVNNNTSEKNLQTSNGFCMTNNNTYFKIVLDQELSVGDVINVKFTGGTRTKDGETHSLGIIVSSTETTNGNGVTSDCSATSSDDTSLGSTLSYTVVSNDEFVGKTTLYVYRAYGANQYFDEFKITREVAPSLPVITTQPVGATYAPDATATALSIVATASAGTLSYQWYSNTTESTEGATAISGATSAEYTPSTTTEGTTYYYCVVTDTNGSVTSDIVAIKVTNSTEAIVGYTEAINGTKLDGRVLTGAENITISDPFFGSNITNNKGTSKNVIIDGTTYANTDSWRKSQNGTYDGQNIGYTLTVTSGYKMNISHVSARIAVADDTYTWYVEILNGAGTQVWKSGEKTSKKTGTSGVVDADVTDKTAIQGMTGDVTVNLWVKQGGSTKYFSINYLQLTVETEVDERSTYTMTVSQNIEVAGTVTPADGAEVTEGESVAFTATPVDAYKFVKWTIDGVDYTENPYVLENVNAAHTAVATFAKRYTVTYDLGEEAGTITKVLNNVNRGNGYDEKYSVNDDSYTIPAYADKYLYKEGYVFDKWVDSDGNEYASGEKISDLTKDITLTPSFKATTQSLAKSHANTVVEWTFAKADILFTDWQSSTQYGYYTKNVDVNGETIAIPMTIIDGKVGNWGRSDAIAQTNQNTKFTIPAISGMKIELANAYTNFSATTIAGSTEYEGTGTKSISYTYIGTDETIDIVIGESNQYLKSIKVTYPKTRTYVDVTAVGYRTFASSSALDFTDGVEGLTAYSASIAENKVTFNEITSAIPAGEGILIKAAEGRYYIPVAATAPTAIDNEFIGVTAETAVEGAGIFVLLNGEQGIGFYRTTAESFTVGANTAYLPAQASARSFIGLGDDMTTGIERVVTATGRTDSFYNLNGQRVTQPTKGLYIFRSAEGRSQGKKFVK